MMVTATPATGINRLTSMVLNYLTSRLGWLHNLTGDKRRSIEDECGHRKGTPTAHEYYELYCRDPIAARVVELYPKECWQVQPRVYEKEDPATETAFEKSFKAMTQGLQPEQGYHQDERGNALWEVLKQVDILSGIGRYGVLFLGLDDTDQLDQPVAKRNNRLLYLTPLSEVNARITAFERDMRSPRFGLPAEYELTFSNPDFTMGDNPSGDSGVTYKVHWERVIHVLSDVPLESKVFALPRMHQVIDRIDDLRKLYGGSAEMYWKGAFPGLAFEGHPNIAAGEIDLEGIRDMAEDYQNGLQRIIALLNMSVKSLSPQVKDPSPQIQRQIEAIAIRLGCPMRKFMGSEVGQLASTQDDASWNDRVIERRQSRCTPHIIVPLVTRLINLSVLKRPTGFSAVWPVLNNQTPSEKAAVTFQLTQAITQFIANDGRELMTDLDYLTTVVGMDETEAMAVIENRKKDPYVKPVPPAPAAPNLTFNPAQTNPQGASNGRGQAKADRP